MIDNNDLPDWLETWDSGSVFGKQSSFLDDVEERQDIFSNYANFTNKGDLNDLYRNEDNRKSSNKFITNVDSVFSDAEDGFVASLDFTTTKDTSYSLGQVANHTNGVELRFNLLQKLTSAYDKYVAFSLAMRTMPRFTDSLRLSKLAEKDNFDSTILKITQEKYAEKFSNKKSSKSRITETLPHLLETIDEAKQDGIISDRWQKNSINSNVSGEYDLYRVQEEWISGLRNYSNKQWNTGLDISLLAIFNASNRVAIDTLMDFSKNVDSDLIDTLDKVEAPIILNSYCVDENENSDSRSLYHAPNSGDCSGYDCDHNIIIKEDNMNHRISTFPDTYPDTRGIMYRKKLPSNEDHIYSSIIHEGDLTNGENSNYFSLNQDNLKELYDLLMDHYKKEFRSIFIDDINNSSDAVEHLNHNIQLSVDWQNIYQDYLKDIHKNSDSEDSFESVYEQISMDSRKGKSMSPTMGRKILQGSEDLIDEVIDEVEKHQAQQKLLMNKQSNKDRARKGFSYTDFAKDFTVDNHAVPMIDIPDSDTIPSYESVKINAMLDHHKSLLGHGLMSKKGSVTHKAWKMNFGDMKVFKKKPITQAKVRVILDVSSSMGDLDREGSNMAKAFMLNNGISKAFYDVETYLCAVNIDSESIDKSHSVGIGRIGKGKMFDVNKTTNWSTHMTTPLCLGLQHIKNSLEGSYENSVCILITDGYPNSKVYLEDGRVCHCARHSKDLCNELYSAGTRFGVINIGHGNQLAPSDCTVFIDEYDSLDSQVTEVNKLFAWLLNRK